MKTPSITTLRNYKDTKFSYPKVKRSKSKSAHNRVNFIENKENEDPENFWNDCKE